MFLVCAVLIAAVWLLCCVPPFLRSQARSLALSSSHLSSCASVLDGGESICQDEAERIKDTSGALKPGFAG